MDTYTFQRDAGTNLLHGIDPYGSTQGNIFDPRLTSLLYGPGEVINGRVQVGFQYPPLTLLWVLPGYLLGDIRVSYILAVIISAWFLVAMHPGARNLWIVSVLLFSPLTFLVERLCWTEPLVLMALSATVYAAVKKSWWLPIALGLFLATKQYNFLALPLIGFFIDRFEWKAYWKLTGLSLAVGMASVLPFAIWNLRGLWRDLVLFHLVQPFRQDAVSFAVPFPTMMKIGPLLLAAFIAWAIRAGRRNAVMFAAAYGVALLLFVLTSKQAFANYYFLIGQAFFMTAAALPVVGKAARPQLNAKRSLRFLRDPIEARTLSPGAFLTECRGWSDINCRSIRSVFDQRQFQPGGISGMVTTVPAGADSKFPAYSVKCASLNAGHLQSRKCRNT